MARLKLRHGALALLALTLALPHAAAHVENLNQATTLQAGPFLVFFEPRPVPPFANATLSIIAQVSDVETGALLRNIPATTIIGGPGGFNERKTMQNDGMGFLLASAIPPAPGNYSARILLKDPKTNETHAGDVEFEVFPNLPFRIRPVDATADTYVGQRSTLAFEIVDPITLARKPNAFDELDVRIEHWSEDHTIFLGAEEITPTQTTPGIWRIEHTFEDTGMYHLRFASDAGGFNYGDVPLLHVYATQAPVDETQSTPGAALGLALGALALAALALRRR